MYGGRHWTNNLSNYSSQIFTAADWRIILHKKFSHMTEVISFHLVLILI